MYEVKVKTYEDLIVEDIVDTLFSAQEYFNVDLMPEIMAIADKIAKRKGK